MKRLMCGSVVLAAAAGLWSCNGDPTESIRDGETVRADPSVVFVEQNSTKFVTVGLVDGQGNPLAADLQIQTVGAGITVEEDTAFLQTTIGERLPTTKRYIVAGVEPLVTSFVVASGGTSATVPVRVIPTGGGIPVVTVASTGPNATDPTVLTVPAGFQFFPDSGVAFDAGAAIIVDRSADGRSLTVFAPPGTTTTGTATILVDFLPTVPLATTTDVALTVNAAVPAQPGATDIATAPNIPLSAVGGGLWDTGLFTGTLFGADQYYQFTIADEGDYTINVDWTDAVDIDYIICADVACSAPDGTGATGAHPELHDHTFTPGTYYLVVNLFTGPTPPWVRIAINPA